jgi:superoxide reductase
MELKFYRFSICGQIVAVVKETGSPLICCGEEMQEIKAGLSDGAREKHVPVFEKNGNIVNVTVGSVEHPMLPEHYIEWIVLQTTSGNQRKALKPGDAPKASFAVLDGDEVVAVYAYCNLHSLWKG